MTVPMPLDTALYRGPFTFIAPCVCGREVTWTASVSVGETPDCDCTSVPPGAAAGHPGPSQGDAGRDGTGGDT